MQKRAELDVKHEGHERGGRRPPMLSTLKPHPPSQQAQRQRWMWSRLWLRRMEPSGSRILSPTPPLHFAALSPPRLARRADRAWRRQAGNGGRRAQPGGSLQAQVLGALRSAAARSHRGAASSARGLEHGKVMAAPDPRRGAGEVCGADMGFRLQVCAHLPLARAACFANDGLLARHQGSWPCELGRCWTYLACPSLARMLCFAWRRAACMPTLLGGGFDGRRRPLRRDSVIGGLPHRSLGALALALGSGRNAGRPSLACRTWCMGAQAHTSRFTEVGAI